jgi:hypothetical protein
MVIITRDEPFVVPIYLGRLVRERSQDVAMVFIDQRPSPHLGFSRLLRLAGPLGFARQSAAYALRRLAGVAGLKLCGGEHCTLGSLLRAHRIPWRKLPPDSSGLVGALASLSPDVLLSVANSRILPREVLAIPGRCLNLHGSLLPRYRGVLTAFWMLYHGEAEAGVTIHAIIPEVDSGAIYGQRTVPIRPGETIMGLYGRLARAGADLLAETVATLGEIEPRPQEPGGEMLGPPSISQIKDFRARGLRFS